MGVIEGFTDQDLRQVLLRVVLDLPSGRGQAVASHTYPRNLKLTSEYKESKEVPGGSIEGPASSQSGPSGSSSDGAPEWAMGSSKPGTVKVEAKFKDLLADNDKNMQLWHLKPRIWNCHAVPG